MSTVRSSVQKYSDWYDNIRIVSLKNPLIASALEKKLEHHSYAKREYVETTLSSSAAYVNEDLPPTDDDYEILSDTSSITGRNI